MNEAPRRKPRKPKKSGLLPEGKDETGGAFALVKGGTASKREDSTHPHALTSSGEAIALRELPEPATRKLVLRASYKSLVSGSTKNAAIAFGESPKNDALFKAGTAIGMNAPRSLPRFMGKRFRGCQEFHAGQKGFPFLPHFVGRSRQAHRLRHHQRPHPHLSSAG